MYKVTPGGVQTVLASGFNGPSMVAIDPINGNLFVPDQSGNVWQVTPGGTVSLFASGFNNPNGLAFDAAGNLYVGDEGTGTISKVTPAGAVSVLASGFSFLHGLAYNAGTLYAIDQGANAIDTVSPTGVVTTYATGFFDPIQEIAFDSAGKLYVPDYAIGTVSTPTLPMQQYTALGTYSDGATQNISSQVSWSLSPSTVATISSTGLVTALTAGTATVEAQLSGVAATTSLVLPGAATNPLEGPAAGSDSDVFTISGPWTAVSNSSWLHTTASGTGDGVLTFSFDANPGRPAPAV